VYFEERLNRCSTRQKADNKYYDGDEKKYVKNTAERLACYQSQKPQDQQNDNNRFQHDQNSSLVCCVPFYQ
jgi:hypothetical protein